MKKAMTPERVMKIEKHWPVRTPAHAAQKLNAIAETFGVSQTRYYARLNQLIDDPEFIALDPAMARILRDRRNANARVRGKAPRAA